MPNRFGLNDEGSEAVTRWRDGRPDPELEIGGLHRIAIDHREPTSRTKARVEGWLPDAKQPTHQRVRIHEAERLGIELPKEINGST